MTRIRSSYLAIGLVTFCCLLRAQDHATPGRSQRVLADPACPTRNKPTLFDNIPSVERQLRFVPIFEDGKLDRVFVQMCKGDPLSCLGYIEKWKWVVEDRDLQLSKDEQVIVENKLKAD